MPFHYRTTVETVASLKLLNIMIAFKLVFNSRIVLEYCRMINGGHMSGLKSINEMDQFFGKPIPIHNNNNNASELNAYAPHVTASAVAIEIQRLGTGNNTSHRPQHVTIQTLCSFFIYRFSFQLSINRHLDRIEFSVCLCELKRKKLKSYNEKTK